MGILVANSDFEKIWGTSYPSIAFDNATYSLVGGVGTALSTTFAVIDNNDVDVSDQCTFTFSNDYVTIEEGKFVCEGLAVGTYTTEVTATYAYLSAIVTATATINISVEQVPATSIAFDSNSYSLVFSETQGTTQSITVTDNLDRDVTEQCSYAFSGDVAYYLEVSNGEIAPNSERDDFAPGSFTGTLTATFGSLTATATVNLAVDPTGIVLELEETTLYGTEGDELTAAFGLVTSEGQILDSGYTLSFSPNDKGLYVDGGDINIDSAIAGQYSVTVTATYTKPSGQGTLTTTATITFDIAAMGPSSISFGSSTYSISGTEGDTITESFTVEDSDGNDVTDLCTYSLSPSNSGLVVDEINGEFDASSVTAGTYSITVTATYTEYNLTDTCTVSMEIAAPESYLTFEALESGTFTLTINQWLGSTNLQSVSYSVDNGDNWVTTQNDDTTVTITTPTVAQGDTVLWKGVGDAFSREEQYSTNFSSTGRFNVSGSIMSLVYGDNFRGQKTIPTSSNYATFGYIFKNCSKLVSVDNETLPATTLANYCYQGMFKGCTALTTAPTLPATTMTNYCYKEMFSGCTALTTAPALNATTLKTNCYASMFYGCTSLTTLPTLPATTLQSSCYKAMFQNCTGITTIPSNYLPATTMGSSCYQSMFEGCTNIATVPSNLLPATTFESSQGDSVYKAMFKNCTSLTTAPDLPSLSVPTWYGYEEMFSGCSSLNYVKAMFTTNIDTNTNYYTKNWLNGVAANGTFVKNAEATWTLIGASGVPSGWTVETASA